MLSSLYRLVSRDTTPSDIVDSGKSVYKEETRLHVFVNVSQGKLFFYNKSMNATSSSTFK